LLIPGKRIGFGFHQPAGKGRFGGCGWHGVT